MLYLLNDENIFNIFNSLLRINFITDFIVFLVNILKIYLLVESK